LDHQLIQILINEEIARIVIEAARGSGVVRPGEHAYRLMRQFPNSGMTGEDMANAIIAAAASARVTVENGQSEPVRLRNGDPSTPTAALHRLP
jgi:hypothetical protein